MVVVRASGLLMCAIAAVEPWYLRAYSASIARSNVWVPGGVDVEHLGQQFLDVGPHGALG